MTGNGEGEKRKNGESEKVGGDRSQVTCRRLLVAGRLSRVADRGSRIKDPVLVNEMKLKERIASLPRSCGVYLFKDASGKILYVGKAANLAKRV